VPAPKTQPTDADVDAFLAASEDPVEREDSRAICRMMAEQTGEEPRMWSERIVGFGGYGDLLERPGRHRSGRSCLYVKRPQDVDTEVLQEMVGRS
jgi:hypothetical protein